MGLEGGEVMRSLSLLLLLACPLPAAADITTNLRVHLKLDETSGTSASDSSGNGQTSTLTNGAAFHTGGQIRGCVDLDGTNDFVSVPAQTWSDGASAMTIACWYRPDTLADWKLAVTKYYNSSNFWQLAHGGSGFGGNNDVLLSINTGTSESTAVYTTGNVLATGTWVHIVAVFDGSLTGNTNRIKFYINGTLSTTSSGGTTPTSLISSASDNILVGWRDDSAATYSIDGRMDDIRMYSRALTAGDVSELYAWRGATAAAHYYYQQNSAVERDRKQILAALGLAAGPQLSALHESRGLSP